MIQALIPLGLRAAEEALQAEVTALAGPRYARDDARPDVVWWGQRAQDVPARSGWHPWPATLGPAHPVAYPRCPTRSPLADATGAPLRLAPTAPNSLGVTRCAPRAPHSPCASFPSFLFLLADRSNAQGSVAGEQI